MLKFFPPVLLGGLTFFLFLIQTFLVCLPLYFLILMKLLAPSAVWRRRFDRWLMAVAWSWIDGTLLIMCLTLDIDWDIEGAEDLSHEGWYLVIGNHQSWADILVLLRVFGRRIPFPKFFTKKELLWLPFLGIAIWGLDFPLVARYSREFLEKHPEFRGRDLEATRRACEKYRQTPVTIVNFPEGTRFTPEKHSRQHSPFHHLLHPRIGGLGLVLEVMGDKLGTMLDTTIVYTAGPPGFWDFLCGRVDRVTVRVRQVALPEAFQRRDLLEDEALRERFQDWVMDLWRTKDALIDRLRAESSGGPSR